MLVRCGLSLLSCIWPPVLQGQSSPEHWECAECERRLQIQGKGKRQGKAAGARLPGVLCAAAEVGAGAGKGLLWHPLVLPRLMLRACSTGTAGYH